MIAVLCFMYLATHPTPDDCFFIFQFKFIAEVYYEFDNA